MLIGYGRVGRLVGEALASAHRPFVVIEDKQDLVEQLRSQGIEAILGNAAAPDVLKAANIAHAASLVVAIPNGFEAGQIAEQARAANPTIEIIARAHSDAEVEHLQALWRRSRHHGRARDRPRHDRTAASCPRAASP